MPAFKQHGGKAFVNEFIVSKIGSRILSVMVRKLQALVTKNIELKVKSYI